MEKKEEAAPDQESKQNWSEAVEDLVAGGDTEGAISLLEGVVSNLETLGRASELASALRELAKLYSSKGFSLKSDHLLSRASALSISHGNLQKSSQLPHHASPCNDGLSDGDGDGEDDWEAIADRETDELMSSQCIPGVSNMSLEDKEVHAPKRRGRGTFSYKKQELYSDRLSDTSFADDVEDEDWCKSDKTEPQDTEARHSEYGTHHVLVLADFLPSTRTMELEKIFEEFKDCGVVIRWVNDTAALAVFRTPSIALEAHNRVQCPFTVRVLEEDDILMGSISKRDLEPPRQRPKTSARTAQRLIAHGMGLKLSSTTFGSRELKTQEEARRTRIVSRQKMRDDAWGDDDDGR